MAVALALNVTSALLWGLFATGVLTLLMSMGQGMGWTRMSFPFMIGSMMSSHRSRAMSLGFLLHVGLGLVFALLYALVFEDWQWATWWLGGLLGIFHGLFILVVVMPMLPDLHPRMASKNHGPTPTRQLEPPGFMALNYGRGTPILTMIAHVVYGILLGAFY
jgi:Na+-transporting methylmalonyl-CoA/oxaloacetate decarboxylase gamma subunit